MSKKIKSLHNSLVKHLVKLREQKEYRSLHNSVVVSGVKLIMELAPLYRFKKVLVETSFMSEITQKLTDPIQADQVYAVDLAVLKKITGLAHPEPIAAEVDLPCFQDVSTKQYLLILDGISDPGNMGTLLRTALALGWEGVLITPGSTDPFNEKALRAAKGATFKMPLAQMTWAEIDRLLKNFQGTFLVADINGEPIQSALCLGMPCALVLGNEAVGVSEHMKKRAQAVTIPMNNSMESLNVASAGAILMHYLKRV